MSTTTPKNDLPTFGELLKKLPQDDRTLLKLRYLDERSIGTMAKRLKMTGAEVKAGLFRARKALLKLMEEADRTEPQRGAPSAGEGTHAADPGTNN